MIVKLILVNTLNNLLFALWPVNLHNAYAICTTDIVFKLAIYFRRSPNNCLLNRVSQNLRSNRYRCNRWQTRYFLNSKLVFQKKKNWKNFLINQLNLAVKNSKVLLYPVKNLKIHKTYMLNYWSQSSFFLLVKTFSSLTRYGWEKSVEQFSL